jgi:hypothetical protein
VISRNYDTAGDDAVAGTAATVRFRRSITSTAACKLSINAVIAMIDSRSKSPTRSMRRFCRRRIGKSARSAGGALEREPFSVTPAESGSCYVSGIGMLCVMRRAVNVRSVEKNTYHSASVEEDHVRISLTLKGILARSSVAWGVRSILLSAVRKVGDDMQP